MNNENLPESMSSSHWLLILFVLCLFGMVFGVALVQDCNEQSESQNPPGRRYVPLTAHVITHNNSIVVIQDTMTGICYAVLLRGEDIYAIISNFPCE